MNIKGKNIQIFFLVVFAVLTFFAMFLRAPFFDEAHAWNIAGAFNLPEIISIEKYEGHLFLWHLILMPFSKNHFLYPHSMYFINWFFCLLALIIFYKKAPFPLYQKALITFSYPFLLYFGIVARCYSIGLLFLFLILAYWNDRLKHPLIFSTLLILLANTSAMAIVGAIPLGVLFIYDLIKNKKGAGSFLILALGAGLVGVQLLNAYHPDVDVISKSNLFIYRFLLYFSFIEFKPAFNEIIDKLTALNLMVLYPVSIWLIFKSKRVLFFHITTITLLLGLFIFKYPGAWWHYLFFFIYMISSVWLFKNENTPNERPLKYFNYVFTFLLCLLFLGNFYITKFNEVYTSHDKDIAGLFSKLDFFNEDKFKIYALDNFSQSANGVLPYFKGAKLYNVNGSLKYTLDEYSIYKQKYDKEAKIDRLAESLAEDKINIGISNRKMFAGYEGYNWVIIPTLYIDYPYCWIYRLNKIKK